MYSDGFCAKKGLPFTRGLSLDDRRQMQVFYKNVVLENFSQFTRKHLCQIFYFKKVSGRSQGCFRLKFCEIFKKTFFYRTSTNGWFCLEDFCDSHLLFRLTLLHLVSYPFFPVSNTIFFFVYRF